MGAGGAGAGRKRTGGTILKIHGWAQSGCWEFRKGLSGLSLRRLSSNGDNEIIQHISVQLRKNYLFTSLDDQEISYLAKQFEVVRCPVGDAIIEQGEVEDDGYYYMLVGGECSVLKNGVLLPGKFGTLEKGSAFGEQAVLFDSPTRGATVMASKGSSDEANAGYVVLYRLSGKEFRSRLSKELLVSLQDRMRDVIKVFDTLSGVDTKIKNEGTIIRSYEPSARWLIKQYRGTILQYVGPTVLFMMTWAALFGALTEYIDGRNTPNFGTGMGLDDDFAPGSIIWHLELIAGVWTKLSPLTTFVATFFLNSAFNYWRDFYWTARSIQGRFNDVQLIVSSYAARDRNGAIKEEAKQALDDVARMQRIFHQLFWSVAVKRFNSLHSPEGLSYLRSFRLITESEYDSLIEVTSNGLGVHYAALLFLTSRIVLAKKRGEIELDTAASQMLLDKITTIRGKMGRIADLFDGRMPMSYVHFVNMLVSTLIFLSPLALFPILYYWSIPAVGILTLFYKGILTLSLMFLDPVDNDAYHSKFIESTGFDVGVLVREVNAGSMRWAGCASALPKSYLKPSKENEDMNTNY